MGGGRGGGGEAPERPAHGGSEVASPACRWPGQGRADGGSCCRSVSKIKTVVLAGRSVWGQVVTDMLVSLLCKLSEATEV